MSVAIATPPFRFRIHRAPLLDPPFDDELVPDTFYPIPYLPPAPVPEPIEPVSPECHTAALRFLNVCLELFNGFRSPAQMWPLLHVEHALAVLDELTMTTRHLSELRRRHAAARIHRRGLRTCEPRAGVAEVAAVLNDTQRTWAMCFRLERHAVGWHCTHLRAVLPQTKVAGPFARRVTAAPARATPASSSAARASARATPASSPATPAPAPAARAPARAAPAPSSAARAPTRATPASSPATPAPAPAASAPTPTSARTATVGTPSPARRAVGK